MNVAQHKYNVVFFSIVSSPFRNYTLFLLCHSNKFIYAESKRIR